MNNKEVIDKLQIYFLLECDPKIVARTLAGLMIDINRIKNIKNLDVKEKANLLDRIEKNSQQLVEFVKNGTSESLKYILQNSDE